MAELDSKISYTLTVSGNELRILRLALTARTLSMRDSADAIELAQRIAAQHAGQVKSLTDYTARLDREASLLEAQAEGGQ